MYYIIITIVAGVHNMSNMDGTKTFTFVLFIFMCLCRKVCSDLPLYATKTGYDLSLETFGSLSNRELNWLDLARATGADVPEGLNSCTPDGIYAVYRHGTRNPSDGDLEDMHSIIDRLQNTEINPEFYLLRDFPKIPIANASQLVEAGWEELRTLAERLITRFPELFPDSDFNLTQFSFQSTNKSRTVDSARGFIEGLLGKNQTCQSNYSEKYFTVECSENEGTVTPTAAVIPHSPVDNDTLLRFYDVWETCSEAVNNGKTDSEQDAFRDGPEIGEVWQRVAKKLAAPGSQAWNISREEVILLSEMCGFDRAMYNNISIWCRLFEMKDLYAPEYHSELKNYWNKAYGFTINYRISCTLAQDVLNYLDQRRTMAMNTPLGSFKFGHSETIIPLIAMMGLYNEPVSLLASNFEDNINRTFRSAKLVPFAGNVAFALYRCNSGTDILHRVQLLINESPVKLDFCASQFCTMDEFKAGIEIAIGACDIEDECAEVLRDGTTQAPGSSAHINLCNCLQFLLIYVAFIGFSFITCRSS